MSSLTVEAHRKRFTIKVTPMQPLSAVVADVLGQLKLLDVRPEDCTLSLRGKALDLSTPVRFAAAGRDKLELKTGREPVLGVHEATHASALAAQPAGGAGESAASQARASTGSTAAAAADCPAQPSTLDPLASAAAPAAPPPAAGPPPPEQPSSQQVAATPPAMAPLQPGATTIQVEGPASAAPAFAQEGGAAPHPSVALFGRRVHVFTRAAEQQAEGGAAGAAAAEDDSFFDFTEADLRRAMASAAAQRARQQGGPLMTAAMREREERRRAEAYGAVPIRLYLPDGQHCLQASLPATAPLSEVLALARAALPPQLAHAAYLFTTPPRTVVKPDQLQRSLYAAKMVPAAKVHVGLDAAAAPAGRPRIRPEVAALAEAPPRRDATMHGASTQQAAHAAVPGDASAAAADRSARVAAQGGSAAGSKGVPKWLKLSK